MNGNFPVAYEPGNLTAIGHDKDGAVLASFTRLTPASGGVKSLKLSIDAPSSLTGTGSGSYSNTHTAEVVLFTQCSRNLKPVLLTGAIYPCSALVADGEDTAMVRASLLDSKGELAVEANDEIVFSVKSGDGKLWVNCC